MAILLRLSVIIIILKALLIMTLKLNVILGTKRVEIQTKGLGHWVLPVTYLAGTGAGVISSFFMF